MTLTELRYILALAQERHFGRAAERCFVSQPTLSVAVKKLEEELGVPLFERSRGSVRPTAVGERVVAQARRVLGEVRTLEELAIAERDQLHSPLRVGAIFTIGPYLFPRLIPELRRTAPQMPLYLEENLTERLRPRLRDGELDVLVLALPFEEPDVLILPLYEEPFDLLLPASHPWTARNRVDHRELDQLPMLMLGEGHCFRDQVLEACPTLRPGSGHDTRVTEGGSLETIRHMVASGLGCSVIPRSAAAGLAEDPLLAVRPFEPPVPNRQVALAWRASFPRPKAVEAFAEAVRCCHPMRERPG